MKKSAKSFLLRKLSRFHSMPLLLRLSQTLLTPHLMKGLYWILKTRGGGSPDLSSKKAMRLLEKKFKKLSKKFIMRRIRAAANGRESHVDFSSRLEKHLATMDLVRMVVDLEEEEDVIDLDENDEGEEERKVWWAFRMKDYEASRCKNDVYTAKEFRMSVKKSLLLQNQHRLVSVRAMEGQRSSSSTVPSSRVFFVRIATARKTKKKMTKYGEDKLLLREAEETCCFAIYLGRGIVFCDRKRAGKGFVEAITSLLCRGRSKRFEPTGESSRELKSLAKRLFLEEDVICIDEDDEEEKSKFGNSSNVVDGHSKMKELEDRLTMIESVMKEKGLLSQTKEKKIYKKTTMTTEGTLIRLPEKVKTLESNVKEMVDINEKKETDKKEGGGEKVKGESGNNNNSVASDQTLKMKREVSKIRAKPTSVQKVKGVETCKEKKEKRKKEVHKCPHCKFEVRWPSALNRHVEGVHLKLKKYSCSLCPSKFSTQGTLDRHHRIVHLGETRFSCLYCDYKSYESNNVREHTNHIHYQRRPYNCELCDYASAHKPNVKRHMNTMHPYEMVLAEKQQQKK